MVINITSRANSKIAEFAKLKQKKYRDEFDRVLLEGERIVLDAVNRGVDIEALLCVNYAEDAFTELADKLACPLYVLVPSVYELVSSTENSQGIIAVAKLSNKKFEKPKGNFLVLDKISDPGNLGTIIRTATACNFNDIYLFNCVDWRNEKVIRATMGTVFDCRLYVSTEAEIAELSNHYPLIVTDMQGKSIYDFTKPKQDFGLIMGNEANGVGQYFKNLAKQSVSLPMANKVESLNVAVATAIIMYILNKQGD